MAELDPLPPDIAALLRDAREVRPVDSAFEEAFERRLTLAIAAGQCLQATAAAKTVGATAFAKLVAFLTRKATIGVAMLGIGTGSGIAFHAAFSDSGAPRVANVASEPAPAPPGHRQTDDTASAISTAPPAAEPPLRPVAVGAASAPAVAQSAATTATAPAASGASQLAEERATLEMGRTAHSLGNAAGALAAARTHERRFPLGKLTEEREVLFVQALASAGRKDEALARATRFAQRYPNSIFGGAVQAAVGER
jgi:hypothetical protein